MRVKMSINTPPPSTSISQFVADKGITEQNVLYLYHGSKQLKSTEYISPSIEFIRNNTRIDNCVTYLNFSFDNNILELIIATARFILKNLEQVAERPEFLRLSAEVIQTLTPATSLFIDACDMEKLCSPTLLLQHLYRWMSADRTLRFCAFCRLLKRYPLAKVNGCTLYNIFRCDENLKREQGFIDCLYLPIIEHKYFELLRNGSRSDSCSSSASTTSSTVITPSVASASPAASAHSNFSFNSPSSSGTSGANTFGHLSSSSSSSSSSAYAYPSSSYAQSSNHSYSSYASASTSSYYNQQAASSSHYPYSSSVSSRSMLTPASMVTSNTLLSNNSNNNNNYYAPTPSPQTFTPSVITVPQSRSSASSCLSNIAASNSSALPPRPVSYSGISSSSYDKDLRKIIGMADSSSEAAAPANSSQPPNKRPCNYFDDLRKNVVSRSGGKDFSILKAARIDNNNDHGDDSEESTLPGSNPGSGSEADDVEFVAVVPIKKNVVAEIDLTEIDEETLPLDSVEEEDIKLHRPDS